MDLVNLLSKLQAISEADDKKADKDYDGDGKIESPEEEHAGSVDKAIKKAKANEDIENVLRGLKAIQESDKDVEEGNEFSGELAKAKAAGKDEFEVAGKKYKVNESKCPECGHDPCECDDDDHEHVDEGIMDKAKELGKKALDTLGHKSDEELLKDLQKRMGVPPEHQHGKPSMARPNESLDKLRALAGIQECGDMEMSPMTVVGGEPQMGINPAMPAEVPTIGAQAVDMDGDGDYDEPGDVAPEQKASFTLTISNGDSSLNMTTDSPDEIIHVMKLAGIKGDAKVEKQPAGNDEQGGSEQKTEESFGNTPAQTNEPNPRIMGDINNWSQKGTGRAPAGSALNKPAGQGDNPMRESLGMLEEYRKFINK